MKYKIYRSRYIANKNKTPFDKVVKIGNEYAIMTIKAYYDKYRPMMKGNENHV